MRPQFRYLVAHFVRRMFAGEEDGAASGVNLGIGAVLALLASPGALASFGLLAKYAHPRIISGGHRFDAYKFSGPDEYFFLLLSTTIMGLVTVGRWNRLLPDRRDFSNLASLPISARDVFLANLTALVSMGLLFAAALNGLSWFLFPAVVTFADKSVAGFAHVAVSHAIAVFSASLFAFFGVFALVGLLMLLVPQRFFRSVSVAVKVCLAVALIAEMLSRPAAFHSLLPPLWFLGLYETLAGFASPAMTQLGVRAYQSLAAVVLISVGAYSLCYRRYYLRLAESLDFVGGARHGLRVSLPAWIEAFFYSRFERACVSFTAKTLLRNERQVLFFGSYVGIGFVLAAYDRDNTVVVPILISLVIISGLRFVFDMPAFPKANWLFQSAVETPETPLRDVARKIVLLITTLIQVCVLAPIVAFLSGWQTALLTTIFVLTVTVLATEIAFAKFQAIPFTCTVEPDLQRSMNRIVLSLLALGAVVPVLAAIERWMLARPLRLIPIEIVCAAIFYAFLVQRRDNYAIEQAPVFEERAPSAFELLKLA